MIILGFVLERNEEEMFDRLRTLWKDAVESSSGKTSKQN